MNKLTIFPFLIAALFLITSCGSSKKSHTSTKTGKKTGINFVSYDKLMPALEKAKKENKLVFVDVYADWCVPCKMMERDVFSDKAISNLMNEKFVSLKINAEKGNGKNIAAIFEVIAYPTLLFLDENGRILERKEGAAYHSELKQLANRAWQKSTVGTK